MASSLATSVRGVRAVPAQQVRKREPGPLPGGAWRGEKKQSMIDFVVVVVVLKKGSSRASKFAAAKIDNENDVVSPLLLRFSDPSLRQCERTASAETISAELEQRREATSGEKWTKFSSFF